MPRPSGRIGRPPTTSRPQILEAARVILDSEGWHKLTVRRLATELGVGATTLYHHVRDKDDLMIQLLDYHASRLKRPELPEDPRERILVAATVMHDSLAAWPEAVEVLTADDLLGESALWMVDTIVGGAIGCGRTPDEAVELYRNIWYYTAGEILVRVRAARRAAEDRPRYRDTVFGKLDEARFPSLAAIGERWPELAERDTFARGLRAFVDGMLAQESR